MRLIDADALVARFSLWLEDDNYADGNTYADIAEDFIIPSINEAETIEELLPSAQIEQQWRVIEKRPMDAEERDYWEGMHNCDYSDGVIYTNIPDDGQKVLVCYYNGAIDIDEFVNDNDGCYFDSNGDMEGIVAWMPLPEPYREGEDE